MTLSLLITKVSWCSHQTFRCVKEYIDKTNNATVILDILYFS